MAGNGWLTYTPMIQRIREAGVRPGQPVSDRRGSVQRRRLGVRREVSEDGAPCKLEASLQGLEEAHQAGGQQTKASEQQEQVLLDVKGRRCGLPFLSPLKGGRHHTAHLRALLLYLCVFARSSRDILRCLRC